MDLLYTRCAGLDVHPRSVSACARIVIEGRVSHEVRTFGTSTRELREMADWLASLSCTHVAMESTGVYWKPVWHVLEGRFELVLANAMFGAFPAARVTSRTWSGSLTCWRTAYCGQASCLPRGSRNSRDLTRGRKQLTREITRHTQRIQKTLEDADVKLTEVISNILGVSGRAILRALITGETDPDRLIELTGGRLKTPRPQLRDALRGRVTDHHRFMLKMHLEQVEHLEAPSATWRRELIRALSGRHRAPHDHSQRQQGNCARSRGGDRR